MNVTIMNLTTRLTWSDSRVCRPHSYYVDRKTLEIELIPIELKLKGWVSILFVINIHKTIWHYTAPALRGTVWEEVVRKDDLGPPRFPYCDRVAQQCRSSPPTIPPLTT